MFRSHFKKYFGFFALAFMLHISSAHSSAAQADFKLLNPTPASMESSNRPITVNTSHIKRIRLTTLNPDVVNLQFRDSLQLNLFEDTQYLVNKTRSQRGAGGAILWTGTVSGLENANVVIVVKNQKICASVVTPSSMYQIRPDGNEMYVVRQISKETPTGIGGVPFGAEQKESRLIQLVNQERMIEGLRPLQYNERLCTSARNHSRDMALANYYSHDSRNGRKFFERIFASGYPVSKCGENIAHGFSTPDEVFEGWMNSPDHKVNIMNAEFTEIGVGYAFNDSTHREYWTQDFGAGKKSDTGQGLRLAGVGLPAKANGGHSTFAEAVNRKD